MISRRSNSASQWRIQGGGPKGSRGVGSHYRLGWYSYADYVSSTTGVIKLREVLLEFTIIVEAVK